MLIVISVRIHRHAHSNCLPISVRHQLAHDGVGGPTYTLFPSPLSMLALAGCSKTTYKGANHCIAVTVIL